MCSGLNMLPMLLVGYILFTSISIMCFFFFFFPFEISSFLSEHFHLISGLLLPKGQSGGSETSYELPEKETDHLLKNPSGMCCEYSLICPKERAGSNHNIRFKIHCCTQFIDLIMYLLFMISMADGILFPLFDPG